MALDTVTGTVQLARHVRRALACCRDAVLEVDGVGVAGPDEPVVLLHERLGVPRLVCEPDSRVARAAGRHARAVLGVGCCRRASCQRRIVFRGRLAVVDLEAVSGSCLHSVAPDASIPVVELLLDSVTVGHASGAPLDVPLGVYLDGTTHEQTDVDGSTPRAGIACGGHSSLTRRA